MQPRSSIHHTHLSRDLCINDTRGMIIDYCLLLTACSRQRTPEVTDSLRLHLNKLFGLLDNNGLVHFVPKKLKQFCKMRMTFCCWLTVPAITHVECFSLCYKGILDTSSTSFRKHVLLFWLHIWLDFTFELYSPLILSLCSKYHDVHLRDTVKTDTITTSARCLQDRNIEDVNAMEQKL